MNGANVQSNDWITPPGSAPGAGMGGPPGINPALPMAYDDGGGVLPDDDNDATSEDDSDSDDAPKSPVDIVRKLLEDNTAKTFPQSGVIGGGTMTDAQKQFFMGAPSKLAAQYLKDHPGYDTSSDDQTQDDGVIPAYDDGGAVEEDDGDDDGDTTEGDMAAMDASVSASNAPMTLQQAGKESDASVNGVSDATQDDPEKGWAVYQHLKHLYNTAASIVNEGIARGEPDVAAHAATKASAMVPNGETVHFAPSDSGGFVASMGGAAGEFPLTPDQMKALFNPVSPAGAFDIKTKGGDAAAIQAVQKPVGDYVHNFTANPPPTNWNAPSPKTFVPGPATASPPPIAMQAMRDTAAARDNKILAPNLREGDAVQTFGQQAVNVAKALPFDQRAKYLQKQAEPEDARVRAAKTNQQGRMAVEQLKQQQVASRSQAQGQRISAAAIVNAYSRIGKDPTAADAPPGVKAAMQVLGGGPAAAAKTMIPWKGPDGKSYLIQQ